MSALPPDYLSYPRRRRGQDIDRYDHALAARRAPARLRGGEALALALVVPLEFFMLNPSGRPFRHPGAMQTPYPDLRHYTTRDYGLRVGAFRILEALRQANLRATFAVNAALLERTPPLIDAILEDGHEIAAHGLDTDSIHWSGLDEKTERAYVAETRALFAARGLSPRVWMSPARQQSAASPDLIREAGFDICLDWECDAVPIAMRTKAGPLTLFPLLNELDDRLILTVKNHDEAQWRAQILEAVALTLEEAPARGAQALGLTLTPYVAGQPFRIRALKGLLSDLAAEKRLLIGGVSALAEAFL